VHQQKSAAARPCGRPVALGALRPMLCPAAEGQIPKGLSGRDPNGLSCGAGRLRCASVVRLPQKNSETLCWEIAYICTIYAGGAGKFCTPRFTCTHVGNTPRLRFCKLPSKSDESTLKQVPYRTSSTSTAQKSNTPRLHSGKISAKSDESTPTNYPIEVPVPVLVLVLVLLLVLGGFWCLWGGPEEREHP
jgi:hypothetical protein